MDNFTACPNCSRNIENLEIHKCRACHKEYCKYCSGGSRPTIVHESCRSTSYKSATLPIKIGIVKSQSEAISTITNDTNISWWEFGDRNEFFLKSIFMFPIRLTIYIVLGIVGLTVGLPIIIIVSIIILLISLFILMPIKSFLYIISFGHWDFFENRFIHKIKEIWLDI